MPVFQLSHPTERRLNADCGFDHAVAFFVTVFRAGRVTAEYDRLQRGYADLEGALQFLVRHGFFSEDDLIEAKLALANDQDAPTEPGALVAMRAIIEFKRAAD